MDNNDLLLVAAIKDMNQSIDLSLTELNDQDLICQWEINQNILREKFNHLAD